MDTEKIRSTWRLQDRLIAAMPDSVDVFYGRIRELRPGAWGMLPQQREPRAAAIGALQFFDRNPHFGVTVEALVEWFEVKRG